MTITIRAATSSDIEQLREFEQGVITAERPLTDNLKDEKICYYDLETLIESEQAHLIVAEIDNDLVGSGYALIKPSKSYEKSECYSYLGFMYVPPEHRRKGINQQIINALIAWSHQQNIMDIRLEVYSQNEGAVKAYEKLGFISSLVEMRLSSN